MASLRKRPRRRPRARSRRKDLTRRRAARFAGAGGRRPPCSLVYGPAGGFHAGPPNPNGAMDLFPRIEELRARFAGVEAAPQIRKSADPERLRELGREHSQLDRLIAAAQAETARRHLAEDRELLRESELRICASLRAPRSWGWKPTWSGWGKSSSGSCSRVTRSTTRTQSSRSAPARAARRPPCSPATSSACTRATPRGVVAGGDHRPLTIRYRGVVGGRRDGVHGESADDIALRESGVHRVQRVPATESQGRIHTSRRPWPCSLRPRRSTSKSKTASSRSTSTAPRARRAERQHDGFRGPHHPSPTGLVVSARTRRASTRTSEGAESPTGRLLDRKIAEQEARAGVAPLAGRNG